MHIRWYHFEKNRSDIAAIFIEFPVLNRVLADVTMLIA
jgi:hypothetical protein